MPEPMFSMAGIDKSYAVPVLRDIDLSLAAGEVHALVGANGAGKTTLCNVISGVTQPDSGAMRFQGRVYQPASVSIAGDLGIKIVMQELNLIDTLSVAENLFFTALPRKRGFIDYQLLNARADDALKAFGLADVDPRAPVASLGVGRKQLLEIARVLLAPCKVLMLDEPTAALTDPQIDLLFEKIAGLKAGGTGIVYVSHRMDEIKRIASRISVLRDGAIVATVPVTGMTTRDIVRLMAGDIESDAPEPAKAATRSVALQVRGLATRQLLRDVDIDFHYGEILGIAGLIGSGRTELLRAIFGADVADAGRVRIDGEDHLFDSPERAVKKGIGLIPEDRKQQGLLLSQPIISNVSLSSLHRFRNALGWIDREKEQGEVDAYRRTLDIQCTNLAQIARELSGGNQQKVSIARWLMKECRILMFDEPTRGIDIQAKMLIYRLLHTLAAQGKAIVVVSSETRELTSLCHRIAVMSNGKLAAEFGRDEWSAEKIMAAAFSAYASVA